jgi:hypothetical protein
MCEINDTNDTNDTNVINEITDINDKIDITDTNDINDINDTIDITDINDTNDTNDTIDITDINDTIDITDINDTIDTVEIKYVCSLGSLCQSSQILKNNNLKKCSYPFDWIFSNCNNIIHCLEDDFNFFLDKSYYFTISPKICGHSFYHKQMFYHHNPLDNENDYNYFIRCVDRFKKLLTFEEHKLFVMMFVNMENIEEHVKNNIINFNNKFSKFTKNYTLLTIFQIKNKEYRYHNFTHNDNIDFLEIHTLSESNGVAFKDNDDNDFLNSIIKTKYNFNVEK